MIKHYLTNPSVLPTSCPTVFPACSGECGRPLKASQWSTHLPWQKDGERGASLSIVSADILLSLRKVQLFFPKVDSRPPTEAKATSLQSPHTHSARFVCLPVESAAASFCPRHWSLWGWQPRSASQRVRGSWNPGKTNCLEHMLLVLCRKDKFRTELWKQRVRLSCLSSNIYNFI